MALCCQVVDLIGLCHLDDADQRTRVRHIPVVKVDGALLLHITYPLVEVEVLDTPGVEGRRAANDPMHLIALL